MRFKDFYSAFGDIFSPFAHKALLEHVERETWC